MTEGIPAKLKATGSFGDLFSALLKMLFDNNFIRFENRNKPNFNHNSTLHTIMDRDHLTPASINGINEWLFEASRPYIKGRVLEIESGIGLMSSIFVENGIALHLNEPDRNDRKVLHEKFDNSPIVRGIYNIDFYHPNFKNEYSSLAGAFSTIFKLNNLKTSFLDATIINNARLLLREKGLFIVLIPANTTLYNRPDGDFEDSSAELKKYNRKAIKNIFDRRWETLKVNFICMPIDTEPISHSKAGLSAMIIARKKANIDEN